MWGSSGLPVTFKAFPRRMVTQDWAWHCIAMDPVSEYHWRPASCFDVKHYICETPLRRSSSGKGGKTQGKAHPPASSDPGCPATGQQGVSASTTQQSADCNETMRTTAGQTSKLAQVLRRGEMLSNLLRLYLISGWTATSSARVGR